jgi:hypothetical protein
MFVAFDSATETAVSALDIADTDRQPGHTSRDEASYRCLACGEPVTYRAEAAESSSGPFVHCGSKCSKYGNASKSHRVTQQGVAKELLNWLPIKIEQIGIERRVGTASDFLIGDVVIGSPIDLVVEVVCSGTVSLRRRLQTMQGAGYTGMIVVVDDSQWSAARIDQHLRRLGVGKVGRFDLKTLELTFGALISPAEVDFNSPRWDQVPEYLT